MEEILGHAPGERIVWHAEIVRYLEALQKAAPDRIRISTYAHSWEGRQLVYAMVGSAKNIANLEWIRSNMQRLLDPRVSDEVEAASIIAEMPILTWLAYGVHGNEISSPDAALLVAYHLLAADGDAVVDEILADVIVVLDPIQNPDGRDRFVHNYRIAEGIAPSADPSAAERNEPWPGGRTNHYHFDLNRDYFALTQPETRGRVAALREWRPPVYVDLHEMGTDSTYYFAPSARPVNPHMSNTQKANEEIFGRNNAHWFDRFGFDYFTREVYDAFYPGYGDSWPNFYGAVGMTYEQASARGMAGRRADGSILHFRDTVQHHFVASIATAQAAARNRELLLADFREYQETAIREGQTESIRAYVLPRRGDVSAVDELANLLHMQGIEIGRARSAFDDCGAINPAGSYVISLEQPAKRLVRVLLDDEVPLEEDFMREQERRRGKKFPDQIYDITAWSLPLMYNVEALPCERMPSPELDSLPIADTAGGLPASGAEIAYLVPWGSLAAGRFLTAALREGLTILSVDKGFTQNGVDYPRGSLVLQTRDNPDSLRSTLEELVRTTSAEIATTDTSWVDDGANFGSANTVQMRPARIAMAWDRPTFAGSAGATRYMLERRFGYPVTPIRTRQLASADLHHFDVLILPSGADYATVLGSKGRQRIATWVSDGGVLIGMGSAMSFLTSSEDPLLASRQEDKIGSTGPGNGKGDGKDNGNGGKAPVSDEGSGRVPGKRFESEAEYLEAIEPAKSLPDTVPGILARAVIDRDHWLTAGLAASVNVLVQGNAIHTPLTLDKGTNALRFESADKLVASGYLWDENRRQMAYKPFVLIQPRQRGFVIGFTADPNFRGFVNGLNVLFLNAVFGGAAHARPAR